MQFEAVHLWHRYVDNETGRPVYECFVQTLAAGRIELDLETEGIDQATQGSPHRRVIVNNAYQLLSLDHTVIVKNKLALIYWTLAVLSQKQYRAI